MKINIKQLRRGADIVKATFTDTDDGEWWLLSIGLDGSRVIQDHGKIYAQGDIGEVCDLIALVASCEER